MSETYGWWTTQRKLTKEQLARFTKKFINSYKHADTIKEKLDIQKEKDAEVADNLLENELDTLS